MATCKPKNGKRKFAEGGGVGRFDEDTYARARKFLEDGEQVAEPMSSGKLESKPLPAARSAPKAEAKAPARKAESVGTPAGAGAAMRVADVTSKPFARIPGPAEGSRADRAIKTYAPPSDEAQREALMDTAGKMSALIGVGAGPAAARRVASAARGMAKPATEATAKIGDKVVKTAAERTAPKMDTFGVSKRSPMRKPKAEEPEGPKYKSKFASGGSVRGAGIAKRGLGRGKMV